MQQVNVEMAEEVKVAATTQGGTTPPASRFVWQWEHKTGFRDYIPKVSQRIEDAYQAGFYSIRVKAGKTGGVPMEIFFNDFLQYDPITTHSRRVRRSGRDTWKQWVQRHSLRRWADLIDYLTERKAIKAFQDYERHRREILEGVVEKPYAVEDLYHTSGCCAKVATHTYFYLLTYLLILLNTIWIGFDTAYYHKKDFDTIRKVGDHLFCTFFTIEILIRFGAFRNKWDCCTDKWFVFDGLLAMMMIIDTWVLQFIFWLAKVDDDSANNIEVLRTLRILKLTRLGRFARLMAAFPELMALVKGILHAIRSVFFTMLLLAILLYIFAIYFTTQAKVYDNDVLTEYFGTWSDSMWYLLMAGVLIDGPIAVLDRMKEESPYLTAIFVFFIAVSNLTVSTCWLASSVPWWIEFLSMRRKRH